MAANTSAKPRKPRQTKEEKTEEVDPQEIASIMNDEEQHQFEAQDIWTPGTDAITKLQDEQGPYSDIVHIEDIRPFRLRLVQLTDDKVINRKAVAGQYDIEYVGVMDNPVIVPLFHATLRTMWSSEEERTVCRSDNGKVGIGDPGGDCRSCPYARWGANRKKPPCVFKQRIYAVMVDPLLPVIWDLKSTAIRSAHPRIMSLAASKHFRNFAIALGFEQREGKNSEGEKFSWLVPIVTEVEMPEITLPDIHAADVNAELAALNRDIYDMPDEDDVDEVITAGVSEF